MKKNSPASFALLLFGLFISECFAGCFATSCGQKAGKQIQTEIPPEGESFKKLSFVESRQRWVKFPQASSSFTISGGQPEESAFRSPELKEPRVTAPKQAAETRAGAVTESKYVAFVVTESMARIQGVNIAELNPSNYQKINREAMEGMGMAPHYVAYLSGEKSYRDGDYDKAINEFSRAISIKADYADAYVLRGNARRRKGDFSRAIEDYNRALGLNSEYAEVYNYRGFVFAQRGDYSRAVADYTQAIRFKKDYADAYFNRAYAHGKLGAWDQAIADYTQVIRLEPGNAVAYNERGKAWSGKGDKAKAAADFETAQKLGKP